MANNTVSVKISGKLMLWIFGVLALAVVTLILLHTYHNNRLYDRFLKQHATVEDSKITANIVQLASAYIPGDSIALSDLRGELKLLNKKTSLYRSAVLVPFGNNHIYISSYYYDGQEFQKELDSDQEILYSKMKNKGEILKVLNSGYYIETVHKKHRVYLVTKTHKDDDWKSF